MKLFWLYPPAALQSRAQIAIVRSPRDVLRPLLLTYWRYEEVVVNVAQPSAAQVSIITRPHRKLHH
jgi:hypothetical protein